MANIQHKLYKAYGKVAKKLGTEFSIMRPADLMNPAGSINYVDTQMASFSQDDKYRSPLKNGISLWRLWLDGRYNGLFDIEGGDYLVSDIETYLICPLQPNLPLQAIKCNNKISIQGQEYADQGDGYGPNGVTIGENIPCFLHHPSSINTGLGYVPGNNTASYSKLNSEFYLYDYNHILAVGQLITDQYGVRGKISTIQVTELGTRVVALGV